MNRNNIWIHVGIAVVLITIAAVLGQIERWRAVLKGPRAVQIETVEKKTMCDHTKAVSEPEVLVRFKPGVSLEQIRSIASANHDILTDEIESVCGPVGY